MEESGTRRVFLRTAATGMVGGLAGCQRYVQAPSADDAAPKNHTGDETESPSTPSVENLPETVGIETLVAGLQTPVNVVFAPINDLRYIATNLGRVFVHGAGGLLDDPLVDLSDQIEDGYEMGLLGIELHPEFPDDKRLFVRYSAPRQAGTPKNYSHTFVLASFDIAEDGRRVIPNSETTVMEIPEPHAAHNAGDLAFGPDGYLYVPTGDGGNFGDTGLGHSDDWYKVNRGGNGQDTTENLLGGILRIDVNADPSEHPRTDKNAPDTPNSGEGYAIPPDNPLVDQKRHRDEYYAWGFRNPYRLSFDRGNLFVGDVGQDLYEEVDLVEKGSNYGWNVKEGPLCFNRKALKTPLDECPDQTPPDVRGGEPLIDPILGYHHRSGTDSGIGTAVIGGYVYRGTAIPELTGRYIFGTLRANGQLFIGSPPHEVQAEGLWRQGTVNLTADAAAKIGRTLAFGRDRNGEVYLLGGGGLHKIVPAA